MPLARLQTLHGVGPKALAVLQAEPERTGRSLGRPARDAPVLGSKRSAVVLRRVTPRQDVRRTDDCFACSHAARTASLPPREAVIVEGGWRVAHAFNSSLAGWLVVLPLRHVTSMDELTETEAETLGSILRRTSRALTTVVGSAKAYVMFFAEAEGFAHLHVHVVPRMEWFAPDQVGPRVFAFLGGPESEWVTEHDRDELALRLRAALAVEP